MHHKRIVFVERAEPQGSDTGDWGGVPDEVRGQRKRRLRFNCDAQRRYRARQKKKVQGLQGILDKLAKTIAEVDAAKEDRASLQVHMLLSQAPFHTCASYSDCRGWVIVLTTRKLR